jgi:hypothetical protein
MSRKNRANGDLSRVIFHNVPSETKANAICKEGFLRLEKFNGLKLSDSSSKLRNLVRSIAQQSRIPHDLDLVYFPKIRHFAGLGKSAEPGVSMEKTSVALILIATVNPTLLQSRI